MIKRRFSSFLFFLCCAFIFVSCAQASPTALPTDLPTSTPTPAAPLIILLAPPDSDPSLVAISSEIASAFATSNGMHFEQRSLLNSADLPSNLAKLIILAPDPGAAALVSAAPQAQVIAIGFSLDSGSSNLVSIPLAGNDDAKIAFVAGYLAAISAEDWRVGILYTGANAPNVNDFFAGVEYFCGSCAPVSLPLVEYPISAQASDTQNWQSAADQLLAQFAKVVYLTPELEDSGAAQYLANSGVLLIGSGTPPAESANSWLVSVASNPLDSLTLLLPSALNGQPLQPMNSLALANINVTLFSEPRQANTQRVIDDLLEGYIQLPTD